MPPNNSIRSGNAGCFSSSGTPRFLQIGGTESANEQHCIQKLTQDTHVRPADKTRTSMHAFFARCVNTQPVARPARTSVKAPLNEQTDCEDSLGMAIEAKFILLAASEHDSLFSPDWLCVIYKGHSEVNQQGFDLSAQPSL